MKTISILVFFVVLMLLGLWETASIQRWSSTTTITRPPKEAPARHKSRGVIDLI